MAHPIYLRPDLHMHSVYSDGTDTPAELIANVRAAGIDLFALTDHDTAEGCAAVQKLLQPGDPRFIGGIEFSCRDRCGKYHILGYCYDVNKRPINEAVAFGHEIRMQKQRNRFSYLKEQYGFTFTEEEKAALMSLKNPGKPHFVELMLRKGMVQSKDEGFEIFTNYHSVEPMLLPEDAIDAILRSDGIPVLAHGILADGSKHLSAEEIAQRVERFKSAGLMGLECYYSTFSEEEKACMLSLAERFNLFVTAGSDYHGSRKAVRLGQTNSPDIERLRRFYAAISYLF